MVSEQEMQEHQDKRKGKRVTLDALKANIINDEYHVFEGTMLTICVLTLKNGFTVTGESACADPAMFDAEIGRRVSRENAERKIWPLMGYALREELHKAEVAGEGTSFQDRVRAEADDLMDKMAKLEVFITGNVQFERLSAEEQDDLRTQLSQMGVYYETLMRRISRF